MERVQLTVHRGLSPPMDMQLELDSGDRTTTLVSQSSPTVEPYSRASTPAAGQSYQGVELSNSSVPPIASPDSPDQSTRLSVNGGSRVIQSVWALGHRSALCVFGRSSWNRNARLWIVRLSRICTGRILRRSRRRSYGSINVECLYWICHLRAGPRHFR